MKSRVETIGLEKIVPGGQTLGTLEDGQKVFIWGALPGETAEVRIVKKKSRLAQGIAEKIIKAAPERVEPRDPDSYLSTSPWQIMSPAAENTWKRQLVQDAFRPHGVELPESELVTGDNLYHYRNKIEFSWWWDNDTQQLDLAFFRRGSKGKIPVQGTSLAREEINQAARKVRDLLRTKQIEAYDLKTLLLRCDRRGNVSAQLYVKNNVFDHVGEEDFENLRLYGLEIIYSNPKSPASVRTKTLAIFGATGLHDTLLDTPFTYATGGFFQVNLPIYEMALQEIKAWVSGKPIVDFYSGVGTIGLTVSDRRVTLVEADSACVDEMRQNVKNLNDKQAEIVQAASEHALDYINPEHVIILDPPRAGLHTNVVDKLNEAVPPRIIYLSCNPTTQARDTALLLGHYKIVHSKSFNFFPRTPHIEHLLVLDKK